MREKKLVIIEIVIWTIIWLLCDRLSHVAAEVMVSKNNMTREQAKAKMMRYESLVLLVALAVALHYYYRP